MSEGRILIVEDESAMLRGLKDALQAKGFEILTAQDGETGLNLALTGEAGLILLDIMLPRVNGYQICRAVRESGLDAPILMLTAKGREEDIILGLNTGADDYLAKPFRIGELMARVRALLRRAKAQAATTFRFGGLELDLASRKLLRNGLEVEMTAKESKLLAYFVSRQGRALARNDILDAVWGRSAFVTGRSVDRCVTTLRAKIEPDPRRPKYIRTIRDIGYRFETGAE